jgi:hypothetical protein
MYLELALKALTSLSPWCKFRHAQEEETPGNGYRCTAATLKKEKKNKIKKNK